MQYQRDVWLHSGVAKNPVVQTTVIKNCHQPLANKGGLVPTVTWSEDHEIRLRFTLNNKEVKSHENTVASLQVQVQYRSQINPLI